MTSIGVGRWKVNGSPQQQRLGSPVSTDLLKLLCKFNHNHRHRRRRHHRRHHHHHHHRRRRRRRRRRHHHHRHHHYHHHHHRHQHHQQQSSSNNNNGLITITHQKFMVFPFVLYTSLNK